MALNLFGGQRGHKTEGLCLSIAECLLRGNPALCYAASEANAERVRKRVAELVGETAACGLEVKVVATIPDRKA